MSAFKTIAITGASRGIGAKLAQGFADVGVKLFLNARSEKELVKLQKELESKGCEVEISAFDLSDEKACRAWCEKICAHHLDLLILNAGISSGLDESMQKQVEISKINTLAAAIPLFYALERMKNQQSGQIALISSVASLLALPNAPAYSASKHFINALAEAVALNYPQLCINIICPGFIKTDLTKHIKGLKMMELECASQKIIKAIKAKKYFYAFPLHIFLIAKFYNILPLFIKKFFVNFLKRRARL